MIKLEHSLDRLSEQGFEVLHDLDVGCARVSHCVVGPTGVFAIELEGRTEPARVLGEAHRIERLLHFAGVDESVRPVLAGSKDVEDVVWEPGFQLREDVVDHIRAVLSLYCRNRRSA